MSWVVMMVSVSLGRVFGGIEVLLKVAFFVWSAALGKIPTIDNLRKRRVIVVDRSCMCKRNRESVNPLLLHCELKFFK